MHIFGEMFALALRGGQKIVFTKDVSIALVRGLFAVEHDGGAVNAFDSVEEALGYAHAAIMLDAQLHKQTGGPDAVVRSFKTILAASQAMAKAGV